MLNEFRSTNITWDKATSRIYSPVTANAGDENGRKLVVQIVNSGQVEDLTGATLHLYWVTRDKAHDGLDVFKAVDLEKGEFELSYTTGMLSNKGVLNANLVLVDTIGRVVSERFKITVTEGIDNDAIQSENSFSSLTQALIDISNLEQNYAPRLNNLTSQLQQTSTQKADKSEVHSALILKRDKSTPIGINDLDGETLGIIQGGSGGNPIEVLSIPRDRSVTGEKTTFLIHDETTNLIDKTTVLKDAYINGAVDGKEKNFVDTNTFYATDFIPIEPGTPYYHGSLHNGYFAFYDANKNYISGAGSGLANPFTGPQNAHYIRVTIRKDSNLPLSWINKTNERPADMRYKWKNISFGDENLTQLEDIIVNKNYLTEVKETDLTFLELVDGANLIIQSEILYDSYIKGDDQGQVLAGSGLDATGYVELKPDTDYYFSDLYIGYYAFYDENKVYITGSGFDGVGPLPALSNPFQIPSNAKYGRFTIGAKHDPANAWINTENATPPAEPKYQFKDNILVTAKNGGEASDGVPTEYNGDDIAIFNHILAIGDSLTAGTFNIRGSDINYVSYEHYAFPKYLQKMAGVTVKNMGAGGKTTKEWYDMYVNTPLTGYDCAIIQLGVNDLIRESTVEETKTYLTNIINKLKTENAGIKIFVSTIIPATSYSNAGYIDISEAIREVVASITSDVYLVDLAVYGHTKDEVAYNNGHLSAYGYWQLAKDYKAYISYIIANNKLAFRNIQFAGTDYTY